MKKVLILLIIILIYGSAFANSIDMVTVSQKLLSDSSELLKNFNKVLKDNKNIIIDNKKWYMQFAADDFDADVSISVWKMKRNDKLGVLSIVWYNTVGVTQEIHFYKISDKTYTPVSREVFLPELKENDFFKEVKEKNECYLNATVGYQLPRNGTSIKAFILNDVEEELFEPECYARLKKNEIELKWTGEKFVKK